MEQSKRQRILSRNESSHRQEFFCADPALKEGETAANIVMATIRPLTIDVDEDDRTAWVSAGVTVWDLMSYLGNYVTETSPRGVYISPFL